MTKNEEKIKFPGFPEDYIKTFWKYPRMLEGYWCMLSGSEQKVLDFILRQTVGFGNDSDRISLTQFQNGNGKNNKGTGLNRKTILRAINGLEEKGFIQKEGERYRLYRYRLAMLKGGVKNTPIKNTSKSVKVIPKKVKNTSKKVKEGQTIDDNYRRLLEENIKKIFSFYKEKICPASRLTREGKKLIAERLKEFSLPEIEQAIDNFSKHNWYMEKHGFRGVKWFFQSEDQIDTFKNIKLTPANGGKEILRRGSYG